MMYTAVAWPETNGIDTVFVACLLEGFFAAQGSSESRAIARLRSAVNGQQHVCAAHGLDFDTDIRRTPVPDDLLHYFDERQHYAIEV